MVSIRSASVPEDYGGYYAWGETEEKSDYTWENYKYYNSSTGGFNDIGSNISGTSYDVAHVKWGGSWRMPTLDEIQELCDKCSWEWITAVNGVVRVRRLPALMVAERWHREKNGK